MQTISLNLPKRSEMSGDFITRRGKKHVVFGHTYEGQALTYCGMRWWEGNTPRATLPHCKNCTRELRKAGMSWAWFETQQYHDRA